MNCNCLFYSGGLCKMSGMLGSMITIKTEIKMEPGLDRLPSLPQLSAFQTAQGKISSSVVEQTGENEVKPKYVLKNSLTSQHRQAISTLKFSPDGRLLASGCKSKYIIYMGISRRHALTIEMELLIQNRNEYSGRQALRDTLHLPLPADQSVRSCFMYYVWAVPHVRS